MKVSITAAMMLLLGACASTSHVLQREPAQVFHSARSVREVAFCLADRNHTTALERDDGSRVVLLKNGLGAVSLAFSIYPEGSGSRIEYRRQFGTVGGIWRQCIGLAGADS